VQRDAFIAVRRDRWEGLEQLLRRAGGNVRRLSAAEVLQLGRLYRAATADLATARRDFPHDPVSLYLNNLVGRAHPVIYRERVMDLNRIGRFLRYGFPAGYRRAGPYTALAFGLFLVSALVAAALVTYRTSFAEVLLPGTAAQLRGVMEQHHLWFKSATENHAVTANFIMLNNIKVAFFAFAGGVLVGTLTIYVMIQNGIMLGATGALVAQYDLSRGFWSFVIPHGVIELSVIFMAGGAGLMIGDAILRPGLQRRRDALVEATRVAVRLIFGAVPLLVIAGTIESYLSPSDLSDALKLGIGLVAGILLYSYLLLSRPARGEKRYTFQDLLESEPVLTTDALRGR
jgi:uncharacterized membrane protein SpoIIM required for sporulation